MDNKKNDLNKMMEFCENLIEGARDGDDTSGLIKMYVFAKELLEAKAGKTKWIAVMHYDIERYYENTKANREFFQQEDIRKELSSCDCLFKYVELTKHEIECLYRHIFIKNKTLVFDKEKFDELKNEDRSLFKKGDEQQFLVDNEELKNGI